MSHHLYGEELASIHHTGYGEFARAAAPWVIATLRAHDVARVVEIGCGSGILARELTAAGFDVTGFDASPSMCALARETAPAARFEVAPFATAELPPCDAMVAMGEVLNHGTIDEVRALVARTDARVLLFDIAERAAVPARDERRAGGDDWSTIVVEESDGATLTRRILTFRRDGDRVRRGEEVHVLELHDAGEIARLLGAHGFRVRRRRSYGTRQLPVGRGVYVATRPRAEITPGRTAESPRCRRGR